MKLSKNGNSKNNDPDNHFLSTFCANCHSLTLTYKTKNIGKGRFSIKNVKWNRKNLINKLYLLCKELNRPLNKEDINKKNGFSISYNTLLRKGIKFTDLNFKKYLYDQQNKSCLNCGELIPYKNSRRKEIL